MTYLDQAVREIRTPYTIRFVAGRWRVYRGTVPILSYDNGAEALAALREIRDIEIESKAS